MQILFFSAWTNLHTYAANGTAANVLIGFFHVIAAFLRTENFHSIHTNLPFFAGNGLCRAGIGADGTVSADRNRILRLLRKWAVCKQGT